MDINKYRLNNINLRTVISKPKTQTTDDFLNEIAPVIQKTDMLVFDKNEISTEEFYTLSLKIRELCSIFNTIFIIKNRVDVALMSNADGVELDENELPAQKSKEILGELSLIGVCTKIKSNQKPDGADYIIYQDKILT